MQHGYVLTFRCGALLDPAQSQSLIVRCVCCTCCELAMYQFDFVSVLKASREMLRIVAALHAEGDVGWAEAALGR